MSNERILRIRKMWPDKIPCVVTFNTHNIKLIMPREFNVAQLMMHVRRQLMKREIISTHKEKALFMFKGQSILSGTTVLSDLDTDSGSAMKFICQEENVFGGAAEATGDALTPERECCE